MDQALLLSVLLSQWWFSVSQYHLVVEPMSWSDAQTHCRQHYSYLATVTDMKDVEELKEAANGHTDAWIGLHRTSESDLDRTWHWSHPTVQYKEEESQWAANEPNNAGGVENCVIVNNKDLWYDVREVEHRCFLCYDETSSTTFMIEPKDKISWLEAQKYCRTHHTDLISGLDQQRLMDQKYPVRSDECWIGLSRDNWGWSDGSNSPFRNWKTNVNPVETKCAALRDEGRWDSDNCGLKKSFICHGGNNNS
uniref:C-type lectin domain-containing protein n=1 Tax=Knipowitschia caucasica TaxID=637954 RepID=A0AAV2JH96_KNICA